MSPQPQQEFETQSSRRFVVNPSNEWSFSARLRAGTLPPHSDVDILVTPSPEASRHDLFIMAAEVEEALGRLVDFLIRSDVEAMKNAEAKDLILKSAVAIYVP